MPDDIQTQIAEQQHALAIAQQNDDQQKQLELYDALGHLYSEQRDYGRSIHAYREAANLASQLKNANVLFRLGIALSVLHEYPQSINCLKQAIHISLAEPNNEQSALRAMSFLADLYTNFLDDRLQAVTYYQQALELARKVEDTQHQLWNLRNIGDAYKELEQYQQALDHYNLALQLARSENDLVKQSEILTNIAYVYAKMGDEQKRDTLFSLALSVAEASKDIPAQVSVLIWQGHAFRDQDDIDQCSRCYHQALALAQEHQDVKHIASCFSLLAHLAEKQRNLQEAIDYYQREAQILREDRQKSSANHRNGFLHFSYTNALESLGKLYEELGDIKTALDYMEQALANETLMASVQAINEHITRLREKLNPHEADTK